MPPGSITAYFNSAEPGGNGSDPNVLLADDFNRGWWYKINGGQSYNPDYGDGSAGGPTSPGNVPYTAGWSGGIYSDPIPNGGVGGVSVSGRGTPYAADHGYRDTEGGNYMADHEFARAADRFWARFDFYLEPGYVFGWEKMLTVNPKNSPGGIIWGGFKFSGDGVQTTSAMHWEDGRTDNRYFGSVTGGHWYSFQFQADRPNHILRIYLDDLGPSGTAIPKNGQPTLVYQDLNYDWQPAVSGYTQFGNLWFENWANAPSKGRWYFTNVMVWENNGPIPIRPSN